MQKAKPVKKVRETDAIFENVRRENKASDERADSLRISIDTKDKVKVGDLSRGGQSRQWSEQLKFSHAIHEADG